MFLASASVWTWSPCSGAIIGSPATCARVGHARLTTVGGNPGWQRAHLTVAMHAIAAVGALEPPASSCCQSYSTSRSRHPLGCSGIPGPLPSSPACACASASCCHLTCAHITCVASSLPLLRAPAASSRGLAAVVLRVKALRSHIVVLASYAHVEPSFVTPLSSSI